MTFNDTLTSFTYDVDIAVGWSADPGSEEGGYKGIGKFLDIENQSLGWMFLNMSYEDTDWQNVDIFSENTLQIYKNVSGSWTSDVNASGQPNDVDTTNNYVYANISKFGSIYGIRGKYNRLPVIDSVIMNSTYGDNLTWENLTVYVSSHDDDGDNVTHIYTWYVNGSPYQNLLLSFDTNNSTTAKDYSGNSNDGTVYGAEWKNSSECVVGGCYDFDGTGNYIFVTDPNLDDNFTIEMWAKLRGDGNIGATGYGALAGYSSTKRLLWNTANGKLLTQFDGNFVSNTELPLNNWYHIVYTFDGSTEYWYVNGVENGTHSTTVPSWSSNFRIGHYSSDHYVLNGSVDEFKLYNRSLSAEQIMQIYLDTKDGFSDNRTIVSQELSDADGWLVAVTPNDGRDDGSYVLSNGGSSLSVYDCGTLTSSGITYVLNRNVSGLRSGEGWCVNIGSDNIVLDCSGEYGFTGNGENTSVYILSLIHI